MKIIWTKTLAQEVRRTRTGCARREQVIAFGYSVLRIWLNPFGFNLKIWPFHGHCVSHMIESFRIQSEKWLNPFGFNLKIWPFHGHCVSLNHSLRLSAFCAIVLLVCFALSLVIAFGLSHSVQLCYLMPIVIIAFGFPSALAFRLIIVFGSMIVSRHFNLTNYIWLYL
jgi:hypothetical protein